jgi:hypothetical protein
VIVDAGTIGAAVEAIDLDDGRLGELVGSGHTVSCRRFTVGLVVRFVEFVVLGIGLVDVAANLQVEFALRCGRGRSLGLGISVLLPLSNDRVCRRLPRLKTAGRIANDLEVAGKRRPNMGRPLVGINLQRALVRASVIAKSGYNLLDN